MTSTAVSPLEIWELTIPGTVAVAVAGEYGRTRTLTAQGVGQRIRIATYDRRIAEEVVRDRTNNPFRNGMLVQINRKQLEDEARAAAAAAAVDFEPEPVSDDELTDDELAVTFGLGVDDGSFEAAVVSLSEVNVRRLQALAVTRDAKASQVGFLSEYIRETYPVGGTTPTYEEMQQRPTTAV